MNWFAPIFTKLLKIFDIPLLVKIIPPERTDIEISLMVTLAINTFETIRIRFSLFSLKYWWIYFEIYFTSPSKMLIMFDFIRIIAFDILWFMSIIQDGGIFLFSTIFTLWNTQVYVCSINHSNITYVRNRPATEPVTLKVHNVKLSFDI